MSILQEKNILRLEHGDWTAAVVPEVGMNLVSIRYKGEPILREPDCMATLKAGPVVYGNPLQIPANRTAHGRFSFDGEEYSLPLTEPARDNHIHGLLHSSAFTVTSCTQGSAEGEYTNRGEIFPFPFRAQVSISLGDDGCRESITVTNTGEKDMPLVFGVHTLFAERDSFSVPLERIWEVNDCFIPTGVLRELNETERSYTTGAASEGVRVGGFYSSAGHTARVGDSYLTVSENFDSWVLWNAAGDQHFIAIEPQQGPVNALNSGIGIIRLAPGQSESFSLWFHK